MNLTLTLYSVDLDEVGLQELTRDLQNALSRELNTNAILSEQSSGTGAKGESITLGTIILTLIGGGGMAVSLVNILKAYIDRGSNIKIRIKGKGSKEVEIEGANLSPTKINQTVNLIKEILGDSK
jgi:hypothetical protein